MRHNGEVAALVEELHDVHQIARMCAVFDKVWAGGPEVVPVDLAAALVHVGAYSAVAVVDGVDAGASFGAHGWYRGQPVLHSHATGATVPGAGLALKLHQREWCRERDVATITWTFDPLVARNAHFNLVKLGCDITELMPDFYGTMTDAINAGDESDRLMATWDVGAAAPRSALTVVGAHIALADDDGAPARHGLRAGTVNLVHIPVDVEAMRAAGDPRVRDWRLAVRDVVGEALGAGWRITGMHDKRAYVLEDS